MHPYMTTSVKLDQSHNNTEILKVIALENDIALKHRFSNSSSFDQIRIFNHTQSQYSHKHNN